MELPSPRVEKKLICKICECTVNARTFNSHSHACRDLAEIRDKILSYQSRLSTHINKAYDLRNQLNTNFAIEKKKLEKGAPLKKTDSTPAPNHEAPAIMEGNVEQVPDQEDNGSVDMEGSMLKRSVKKSKTIVCHVLSPPGTNTCRYEDETLRSLQILKTIIQYGQISLTNINEANADKINDFKVKNQVNILYVEIKDKQISEYVQTFLELIQKLMKYKGLLTKKQEDIERIEDELFSLSPTISENDLGSPQLRTQISKNSYKSHKSYKSSRITSLDDGNITERTFRKPSLHLENLHLKDTFTRIGSARNLTQRNNDHDDGPHSSHLPRKPDLTPRGAGLSKFASTAFFKDFMSEAPASAHFRKGSESRRRKGKVASNILKDIGRIAQVKFRYEMTMVGLEESPEKLQWDKEEDGDGSKDEEEKGENGENHDYSLRRVFTFNVDKIDERKKKVKEYKDEEGLDLQEKETEEIEEGKEENKEGKIEGRRGSKHKRVGSWDNKAKKVNLRKLLEGNPLIKDLDLEFLEEGLFLQGPVKSSFSTMDNWKIGKIMSQRKRKGAQEEEEEIDEEPESLSLFTIRGYYSDSEVNQVRKLELQNTNDLGIDEFDFIRLLGEGAYGKVYLVRKKKTGDLYAMKIVDYADKDNKNNKTKSLRTERDVYKLIQGDWVVKAYYTFNHESYICFVQEYIIGGDLHALLEQTGCFDECVARFYFAELILAVESLHELGIVHRDLKPNNVMIDATGHIKLTDFGLSEVGLERLRMNTSTLRSLLTRENSVMDNSPPMNREEAFAMIERTNSLYFQRQDSKSPEHLITINETMTGGGTLNSLQRLDSLGYDNKDLFNLSMQQIGPQTQNDFGMRKNKLDEATVFPFLATPEERANWIKKDHKMGISQSLRKKEKRRIVGTPDYIAPEIIRGEDCNNKAIDLWSLGVILYEFLVGIPPFNDETIDKIFGNILQLQMEWPDIGYGEDCMTPEAADLIKKLINPNPKERLNTRDIKRHPFFKGYDWQNSKQMAPPLVPKKKDIDPNVPLMDIGTIFKQNDYKLMKRNSIIQEIPTFNTKRYDLLHQLNQSLYRNHLKENPDDEEEFEYPAQLRSSVSTLYP